VCRLGLRHVVRFGGKGKVEGLEPFMRSRRLESGRLTAKIRRGCWISI